MKAFQKVSAFLAVVVSAGLGIAHAQDLKPLSAEDKARVDELLKSFDPNSYQFNYQYRDASGKVQSTKVGRAKGLADLRQTGTIKKVPGGAAATNTNINIFKPGSKAATNTNINIFKQGAAGTNTNINLFKEGVAGTNTNINLFKEAGLNNKAIELNQILQKYYVEAPAAGAKVNQPR